MVSALTLASRARKKAAAQHDRAQTSTKSACILDAIVETTETANARIMKALAAGDTEFVLTSGDGKLSVKVSLRLPGAGRTVHVIAGQSVFVDWSDSAVENGRARQTLSRTELRLFAALLDGRGRTMTRSELIERVWPGNELPFEGRENALAVYVCCLRKRLAAIGVAKAIDTVRGTGYRLAD